MELNGVKFTEQRYQINGVNWVVNIAGEGEPLMLMHGFPDAPQTWKYQVPVLIEAGYQVILPYLPGYGPSSVMNSDSYYPGNFADDLPALLDAMDIDQVTYIGHDWGAYAGNLFVAAAPERIKRLVTSAIPHYQGLVKADYRQIYRSRYILLMQLPGSSWLFSRKSLHKIYLLYREWSPDWEMDFTHLQTVKDCLRQNNSLNVALSYYRSSMKKGAADKRLRDLLQATVSVPTLSIAGANDGCIGLGCFENQAAGYDGEFHFRTLEGAGHFCHLEKPDAFNELVLEFLKGEMKG